jgi:hypothetical protein
MASGKCSGFFPSDDRYSSVGGHRDGLNVFEVLIPGTLGPGQEPLDRPIISGAGVRVADRDRKRLEELFPG